MTCGMEKGGSGNRLRVTEEVRKRKDSSGIHGQIIGSKETIDLIYTPSEITGTKSWRKLAGMMTVLNKIRVCKSKSFHIRI